MLALYPHPSLSWSHTALETQVQRCLCIQRKRKERILYTNPNRLKKCYLSQSVVLWRVHLRVRLHLDDILKGKLLQIGYEAPARCNCTKVCFTNISFRKSEGKGSASSSARPHAEKRTDTPPPTRTHPRSLAPQRQALTPLHPQGEGLTIRGSGAAFATSKWGFAWILYLSCTR